MRRHQTNSCECCYELFESFKCRFVENQLFLKTLHKILFSTCLLYNHSYFIKYGQNPYTFGKVKLFDLQITKDNFWVDFVAPKV